MASARWSGLREQERLEALHHTAEENEAARRRTHELLNGGYAAVRW